MRRGLDVVGLREQDLLRAFVWGCNGFRGKARICLWPVKPTPPQLAITKRIATKPIVAQRAVRARVVLRKGWGVCWNRRCDKAGQAQD